MSTNCSQTQECAGKLDLMRVGKMSVHQWINTPLLSTSTRNTFTHDYGVLKISNMYCPTDLLAKGSIVNSVKTVNASCTHVQ